MTATVATVPITAFVTVHVVSKLVQRLKSSDTEAVPIDDAEKRSPNEDELMATTVVQVMQC